VASQSAQIVRDHEDWTHDQQLRELNSLLDPAVLDISGKKWCPGPECFYLLTKNRTVHAKCGWAISQRSVHRPSSVIQDRAGEAREEVADMEAVMRPAVAGDNVLDLSAIELPPMDIVSSYRKSIYDPCTRPFNVSVGLLWMEALTFTLRLINNNNSERAWTLWMMLAQCTISASSLKRGGAKGWATWDRQAAVRLQRWLQGDFNSLWHESVQEDIQRQTRDAPGTATMDAVRDEYAPNTRSRVERLVGMGRFSDAADAVLAEAPVALTAEVVETLRAKFPQPPADRPPARAAHGFEPRERPDSVGRDSIELDGFVQTRHQCGSVGHHG
jgi:hypothetical protein